MWRFDQERWYPLVASAGVAVLFAFFMAMTLANIVATVAGDTSTASDVAGQYYDPNG